MFIYTLYVILKGIKSQCKDYPILGVTINGYKEGVYKLAQKNMLRYVILGLLSKKSMSGYDIKKAFEGEIGDFWYSNHSQIYPELGKMEDEGVIVGRTEIVGTKLAKKSYEITAEGRTVFNRWLNESLHALPPTRDEFAMKVYFLDSAEDGALKSLFDEELQRHEEKLSYLESRWQVLFEREEQRQKHFGHALILERAIQRERDQLCWLSKAYKRIK